VRPPSGTGFIVETKPLRYSCEHAARAADAAPWLARQRRRYPGGVRPVICVTRARPTKHVESGVLVVSLDRLIAALEGDGYHRVQDSASAATARARGPSRASLGWPGEFTACLLRCALSFSGHGADKAGWLEAVIRRQGDEMRSTYWEGAADAGRCPAQCLHARGTTARQLAPVRSLAVATLVVLATTVAFTSGATDARAWSRPAIISAAPGTEDTLGAHVAMTAAGTLTAVWPQGNVYGTYGSTPLVMTTVARSGSVGERTVVGSTNYACLSTACSEPNFALALAPNGDGLIAWIDRDGRVLARGLRGGVLGSTIEVAATGEPFTDVDVGVDALGNAILTWEETSRIMVRRMTTADVLEPAVELARGNGVSSPQLGVDSGGNAVAVWRSGAHGYLRTWSGSGVLGDVRRVSTRRGADTRVAVAGNGSGAVVWTDRYRSRPRLRARRVTTSGGLSRARTLSRSPMSGEGEFRLGVAASGNAFVVWTDESTQRTSLRVRRFGRSSALTPRRTLASFRSMEPFAPEIAVARNGRAVVGWQDGLGDGHLNLRRVTASGRLGRGKRFRSEILDLNFRPQLTTADDGYAAAVWSALPAGRSQANPSGQEIHVTRD
jgi:hypothetical protein